MALAQSPNIAVLSRNGAACPLALHFSFTTTPPGWGSPGLYLEDLFVLPEMRGKGIGKALLQRLAQIALKENCYGLRWMVLEWNESALKFYETLGAELLGEWETMLLRRPALARLASSDISEAVGESKSANK
jgi:GNAT superfamily N-acetyltransferase